MKIKIKIEKFDNGITICWHDIDNTVDDVREVAIEGTEAKNLGKMILEDVNHVMNGSLSNEVEMEITINPMNNG